MADITTADSVLFVDPERSGDEWSAEFPEGWHSVGVVHGGIVVAMMARAAVLDTPGMHPAAITTHFHSGTQAGPARIHLEELNRGRTARSLRVVLEQDRKRATATILLTTDGPDDGIGAEIPPSADETIPAPPSEAPTDAKRSGGFTDHLDIVRLGENRTMGGGEEASLTAWMRPRRPHSDHASVAAFLLDAMAPSLYARRSAPQPILSIEYTVHLTPLAHRAPRGEGWLYLHQETAWAVGELCVDDAVLRDEAGDLIGTSRQLRRVLPPPVG